MPPVLFKIPEWKMPKPENPVLLAQIGAPHGVKGEVRVKSFTSDPMALADYGPLYAADGRKFKIVRLRPANTVLVVKFKGFNWRDEVEKLKRVLLVRLPDCLTPRFIGRVPPVGPADQPDRELPAD